METGEVLIPIVLFLTVGGILGTYFLTRHKERMTMIEKGLKAEDIQSLFRKQMFQINPLTSLKWGMVLTCVGIAIMLGVWLRDTFMFNDGIFPGLIATFGGVALVVFYFIASKKPQA